MNWLAAKLGSNAIPNKPLSPEELTVNETKGVANKAPFFITRSWPVCCATKILPSGAKAITVGLLIPLATSTWLKFAGNVCEIVEKVLRTNKTAVINFLNPATVVGTNVFMRKFFSDKLINKAGSVGSLKLTISDKEFRIYNCYVVNAQKENKRERGFIGFCGFDKI